MRWMQIVPAIFVLAFCQADTWLIVVMSDVISARSTPPYTENKEEKPKKVKKKRLRRCQELRQEFDHHLLP